MTDAAVQETYWIMGPVDMAPTTAKMGIVLGPFDGEQWTGCVIPGPIFRGLEPYWCAPLIWRPEKQLELKVPSPLESALGEVRDDAPYPHLEHHPAQLRHRFLAALPSYQID
jgi:hypothetical protein